jgi:hypothetical protein
MVDAVRRPRVRGRGSRCGRRIAKRRFGNHTGCRPAPPADRATEQLPQYGSSAWSGDGPECWVGRGAACLIADEGHGFLCRQPITTESRNLCAGQPMIMRDPAECDATTAAVRYVEPPIGRDTMPVSGTSGRPRPRGSSSCNCALLIRAHEPRGTRPGSPSSKRTRLRRRVR